MQVDFLDRYSRGTSVVHRLDARVKLFVAAAIVVAALATPPSWWPAYAVEALVVLAIYAASRLPWRYLAVRLAVSVPFIAVLAITVPVSQRLEGGWGLAALLVARALVVLAVMITLVATTPFTALLAALARLRVPQVLLSILAFMYRYMFVLTDELAKMRRAKLARTFYPSLGREVGLMGNFVGILFVRTFERAERVYAAMCARGWSGSMPRQDGDG